MLALQPNKSIVRGNFTFNIIARAAPAAICVVLNVILTAALNRVTGISQAELSTIAVYITSFICLMLIVRLSIPFNALRGTMLALSVAGLGIAFVFFSKLFMLACLGQNAMIMFCIFSAATLVLFNVLYNIADKMIEKNKNKIYGKK